MSSLYWPAASKRNTAQSIELDSIERPTQSSGVTTGLLSTAPFGRPLSPLRALLGKITVYGLFAAIAVTAFVVAAIALWEVMHIPPPAPPAASSLIIPGEGDPASATGSNGNWYQDDENGAFWYKTNNAWELRNDGSTMIGDVIGVTANNTVAFVGGLTAAYIVGGVELAYAINMTNSTQPDISVNNLYFPFAPPFGARFSYSAPSILTIDNNSGGDVTINLTGNLNINGFPVGTVRSNTTSTQLNQLPVYASTDGRLLAPSPVFISNAGDVTGVNTITIAQSPSISVVGVSFGSGAGAAGLGYTPGTFFFNAPSGAEYIHRINNVAIVTINATGLTTASVRATTSVTTPLVASDITSPLTLDGGNGIVSLANNDLRNVRSMEVGVNDNDNGYVFVTGTSVGVGGDASSTPNGIDLGEGVSDTPGQNAKHVIFRDSINFGGIGYSTDNHQEYIVSDGTAAHAFWVGGSRIGLINSAGLNFTNVYATEIYINGSALGPFIANGTVDGPSSVVPNSLARWDGATGRLLKDGAAVLSDGGALTGLASVEISTSSNSAGTVLQLGSVTDWTAAISLTPTRLHLGSASGLTLATSAKIVIFESSGVDARTSSIGYFGTSTNFVSTSATDTYNTFIGGTLVAQQTANLLNLRTTANTLGVVFQTGIVNDGTGASSTTPNRLHLGSASGTTAANSGKMTVFEVTGGSARTSTIGYFGTETTFVASSATDTFGTYIGGTLVARQTASLLNLRTSANTLGVVFQTGIVNDGTGASSTTPNRLHLGSASGTTATNSGKITIFEVTGGSARTSSIGYFGTETTFVASSATDTFGTYIGGTLVVQQTATALNLRTTANNLGTVLQIGSVATAAVSSSTPNAINLGSSIGTSAANSAKIVLLQVSGALARSATLGYFSTQMTLRVSNNTDSFGFYNDNTEVVRITNATMTLRPNSNNNGLTLQLGTVGGGISASTPTKLSMGQDASAAVGKALAKFCIYEDTGSGCTGMTAVVGGIYAFYTGSPSILYRFYVNDTERMTISDTSVSMSFGVTPTTALTVSATSVAVNNIPITGVSRYDTAADVTPDMTFTGASGGITFRYFVAGAQVTIQVMASDQVTCTLGPGCTGLISVGNLPAAVRPPVYTGPVVALVRGDTNARFAATFEINSSGALSLSFMGVTVPNGVTIDFLLVAATYYRSS
jgi:hypothetical protein